MCLCLWLSAFVVILACSNPHSLKLTSLELQMNEKSFLLPGHGTKLLKFKLDRDQGRTRPDPEELRGEYQNKPRFAGGHRDEEMMPPVRR